MNSSEIKNFIKFLQNNGGAVISGHNKLSVTPCILKSINQVINVVKENLYTHNISTSNLISEHSVSNELLFLYEFIKKTPKLKIGNTFSSHDYVIDISDFTNLKYLELYKVNIKNVKGTNFLRETLEIIVCNRCLENLCDVLTSGKVVENQIWSKLKHAVMSRNNITFLDDSLIYTPWLQYLDISYNHITDLQPLACLSNLTYLDASFNCVKRIPVLNEFSISKLKVLLLRNNYISDITGLVSMVSLRECDLSENSLADHSVLFTLSNLYSLLILNLSGNPLSFHPMHRSLTCGYLHENTANENFELDKIVLTKTERDVIRYGSKSQIFSDPKSYNTDSFLANLQFASSSGRNPLESSSSSISSSNCSTIKKHKRIRDAIISEQPFEIVTYDDIFNSTVCSNLSSSCIKSDQPSAEHLETKKQIESLIEEFGEDHWLHSKGGTYIQDLLGIQKSENKDIRNSSPKISDTFNARTPIDVTKILLDDSMNIGFDNNNSKQQNNEESCSQLLVNDENREQDEESNEDSVYPCSRDSNEDNTSSEEEEEIGDRKNETLWLVKKVVNGANNQDMFVILNDQGLKEIDKINFKTITYWDLDCIERCIKISADPVTLCLQFNVGRHKDKHRKYIMEYADAQKLLNKVQAVIASRPLSAFNQVALRCMKCNTVFCQEINHHSRSSLLEGEFRNLKGLMEGEKQKPYSCTSCGSTSVIEEDDPVLPGAKLSKTDSPPLSSIGSANSLYRSMENVNGSESQSVFHESDIEIMSNPSQSSIEVLEIYGRLHSDSSTVIEECDEVTEDSIELLTTPVTNKMINGNCATTQGLTESSSSGSMTDSVCTTYESTPIPGLRGSHRMSQSTMDEVLVEESSIESSPVQRNSEEKEEPSNKEPKESQIITTPIIKDQMPIAPAVSSYTSLLEDLLHSVSSRLMPAVPVLPSFNQESAADMSSSIFDYSYSDFSQVDHRLKLYFYDTIFEEDEHFVLLLKVDRLYKAGSLQSYPGFFLVSTKKIYFLKIVGPESSDNIGIWIQRFENYKLEKVKLIQPIIWKQGFVIEIDERLTSSTNLMYLVLLLDETRTNNFISFITNLGNFHVEKTECGNSVNILNELITTDENIRNFSLSELITVHKVAETDNIPFGVLIVTNSELFIMKGDLDWLIPSSQIKPSVVRTEKMSNLINVEMCQKLLILQFIDETDSEETSWKFKLATESAANVIVDAIRDPWQELFSIPLQIGSF